MKIAIPAADLMGTAAAAALLGERAPLVAQLLCVDERLREQTMLIGGRRLMPRSLLPEVRAALQARRRRAAK